MFVMAALALGVIVGRLAYIMLYRGEYYSEKADSLHERERSIKAPRGRIYDRNGNIIADNKAVCSISVIHSQIEDEAEVTELLTRYLDKDPADIRKKVEKVSSRELIASNVDKETGKKIKAAAVPGIKVDEDYKRSYPYDTLASKVIGFTGADNQGILGLEVTYDSVLTGTNGSINAVTDARGIELAEYSETRTEPIPGNDLVTTLDLNIQRYVTQAAEKVQIEKKANRVCAITINPQNGEIYAMVDVPEYNLNEPFKLVKPENDEETDTGEDAERNNSASGTSMLLPTAGNMDELNNMWRNYLISDTYEPGSTFKIITASACLEEGVVSLSDTFSCPGYRIVEDRKIRCHKVGGHGQETFIQGIQNSCNPVFIDIGLRLGAEKFYAYFKQFGLLSLTNIDLPGEAGTIMHNVEDIGLVELATISFGQSFQVTPVQMATTVSSLVNGGYRVTPHFGVAVLEKDGTEIPKLKYKKKNGIVSEKTSETMRILLKSVVEEGSGKNGYIEGYSIGGKTATSQTLPRSANKYISSFIGFAPAEDPQVLGIVVIRNPQGIYYGGTIAAPVLRSIYDNVLPYLGIEKK